MQAVVKASNALRRRGLFPYYS